MKTIDKVKKIIAEQLCISTDDISDTANVVEDLGADSLDVVEMLMTFEDEFNVSIPDEQLKQLSEIRSVVKLIEQYTNK